MANGRFGCVGVLFFVSMTTWGAQAAELDFLQVLTGPNALEATETELFMTTNALFAPPLPRVSRQQQHQEPIQLVKGSMVDDGTCTQLQLEHRISGAFGVLLERGGDCSFVEKTVAAQAVNASLVLMRDTIQGAYASSFFTKQPIFDCAMGQGEIPINASASTFPMPPTSAEACASNTQCISRTCVLTGAMVHDGFQVCCFRDALVQMNADVTQVALAALVTISAVFLSYHDATVLERLLTQAPVYIRAFNAEEDPWNLSMFLTWALGVAVVMGAAYHSCTDERRFSYRHVTRSLMDSVEKHEEDESGYVSIDDDAQATSMEGHGEERLQLTTAHALYFLIGASSMLLIMYYGHVLLLLQVLFGIGTAGAMAQLVFVPLVARCAPHSNSNAVVIVGSLLAVSLSIVWFLERSNPAIWPLQDALCIALVFVFIDAIQLPSLRVATYLFVVAFCYDVFFVYLSPLVFGSNVMVDVASGGGNVRLRGADYCERHPKAPECHHDGIPMVLTIPLWQSFYGGNALLGLGDLIIPGLLVSFCIRYDYCMGYPLSRHYFCVASVSYAIGLLMANVMAIMLREVVAGQPALMYIVPVMLTAVLSVAKYKRELHSMWEGPSCLDMQVSEATRAEEREPFLRKP